jgi:flagellar biosynthetic protein FliO
MRIALYLAITAGATFVIVWGIKRLGLAGRSKLRGGSMDVLEAVALGQNKSLALVRVVDKVYLIGQTQTQITLLDTMEGTKAIELIASSKGGVSIGQFKDVFNSFMDRFKAK